MASTHHEQSPDIDKGWAFVVAICAFVIQIFTLGLSFSNSIFYANFIDEFQESPVTTAWAINLNLFCIPATAVIANCFLIMTGPRITLVIACLMSEAGLIVSSFVTSPIGILGTYGLLTGCGFGFTYFVTFSQIPNNFRKYRIITTAVVATGSGVGQFINPPMVNFLIDKFHWRGAFIILAGINLNILVLAAAIIPPREENMTLEGKSDGDKGFHAKRKKALNSFKTLLSGISIFKNPLWCMFCLAAPFATMAQGGFLTHIYNFARSSRFGFSTTQETFLPSIVGIGSVFGQITVGTITQLPTVHVMMMFTICFVLLITGSIAISFVGSYGAFVFCCMSTGLAFGMNAIVFEAVVHILGLKLYSTGLSYDLLFASLGLLFGGPFSAWVYELDPSYLWSFRALSISASVSTVLFVPLWLTIKDGKIQQRKSKAELTKESVVSSEKLGTSDEECISLL